MSYGKEDRGPEARYDVLSVLMAAVGMVLLVYVAALSVIAEFIYRQFIAAPMGRLLAWLR